MLHNSSEKFDAIAARSCLWGSRDPGPEKEQCWTKSARNMKVFAQHEVLVFKIRTQSKTKTPFLMVEAREGTPNATGLTLTQKQQFTLKTHILVMGIIKQHSHPIFRPRALQNKPGTCLNSSGWFSASNLHVEMGGTIVKSIKMCACGEPPKCCLITSINRMWCCSYRFHVVRAKPSPWGLSLWNQHRLIRLCLVSLRCTPLAATSS